MKILFIIEINNQNVIKIQSWRETIRSSFWTFYVHFYKINENNMWFKYKCKLKYNYE